ncbi:MAG: chromosome segregation protein SMC [Acidobacteria bacterium]|nr:chromosome segregation protein SMC [Acidobacteriota bacterium]
MRLQRLELNGFKSFSDRVELMFDTGVTAIVGPNGCGKSNVADAIVWVMGEQSAKSLRGDRMEDVIFSGSDARKATASAEVRLLLAGVTTPLAHERGPNGNGHAEIAEPGHGHGNGHDNGPGHVSGGNGHVDPIVAREVEVTRRLYRSGESEYLINGEVCRLRDVHELLMDTGLGAKNYAIIEQGKIGLILSTRPTDRRQLIEEAAGVTKYKTRRRAAELKLEAAQQNLIRIDDIVFEVEKQRNALKRQAARARRYKRLRDELRRWEKVLFARRYRALAQTIETTRARLSEARESEAAAAAAVAEHEQTLARLRIALAEAEAEATAARDAAHARELEMDRRASQIEFNTQQIGQLDRQTLQVDVEVEQLASREEPVRRALDDGREAARHAREEREHASDRLTAEIDAHRAASQRLDDLEADVEAARSEVFAAISAATTLKHAVESADSASDRVAELIGKLEAETQDLDREAAAADAVRAEAAEGLQAACAALAGLQSSRAARETELATARIEHEWRARETRSREHELAALEARLASLEELAAARAGYGDAARMVLAESNGSVRQRGSVADYLAVPERYERAVEACLGDLLQHVVVESHQHAATGLEFVRERNAGRCGFVVAHAEGGASGGPGPKASRAPDGLLALSSVVQITGPAADAIRHAIGEAWIAETWDQALGAAARGDVPVSTLAGEVFRGPHVVSGGDRTEARGILATKREIKELHERSGGERTALERLAREMRTLDETIAGLTAAIGSMQADEHLREKEILSYEMQLGNVMEDVQRIARKRELLNTERRSAEEERDALEFRRAEARDAIARLQSDQRTADERLGLAQRRLFEGREAVESLSQRAAEARATHAALIERAAAHEAEVGRIEETLHDLESRLAAASEERRQTVARRDELKAAITELDRLLLEDQDVLESLRSRVGEADERLTGLRQRAEAGEAAIRLSRQRLDECRASLSNLEIARATAEGDLAHLAETCLEAVQSTLEEVTAEVEALEAAGHISSDWRTITGPTADVPEEPDEEEGREAATPDAAPGASPTTPEEAVAELRRKVDRLGPVNMMAIEQFDELDERHRFLATQRKDLVDSIAATVEAIRRIDHTTRERFREALEAINGFFQQTFSTLFGGGRAGLVLLDEQDILESGIEIIAQPPGKRLQNVQLLSGGEKALTAISLMFALFRHKPSPFCLLDEIDAPLDDANIGRFVEMLRGMQDHTQFILITHNRKTMEIADRLYGITMEEPGVSKLISVKMN